MANGDIGSQIDYLAIDPEVSVAYPNLIRVDSGIFAAAVCDLGATPVGTIITFSVDKSGNISDALIDSLQIDTTMVRPHIVRVSGDYYVVVYEGPDGADGKVATFTIDNAGSVGSAVVDTLVFDTTSCYIPRIVQVSGTMYAVCYMGASGVFYIKTFNISAVGVIDNTVTGTYSWNATTGYGADIIHVAGQVFLVAYGDNNRYGQLFTLTIPASGVIASSPTIDTLAFDESDGGASDLKLLHRFEDIYAVAYNGTTDVCPTIITIDVDASGNIASAVTDTLAMTNFLSRREYGMSFVKAAGDTYFIAFSTTTRAVLAGFTISPSGVMPASEVDSYNLPAGGNDFTAILAASPSVLIVAERTYDYIRTFDTTAAEVFPIDELLRVSGIKRSFWASIGGQPVYQMIETLGGMSVTYVSPIGEREPPSAVKPTPLPSGPGYQNSDYLAWLSSFTSPRLIMTIFGHMPSYEEWVRWKIQQVIK